MPPLPPNFPLYAALIVATLVNVAVFLRRPRASSAPPASVPDLGQSSRLDINAAMETVLVRAVEGQASMFERIMKLNTENAAMAADMLVRDRNRRAGRTRAKGALRSRDGIFKRNCRLCQNPMISDPTVAEVVAHAGHRVGADHRVTESNGAVNLHVNESEVDGENKDRIEDSCPTCGGQHPAGQGHLFGVTGGSNGTS